MLMSHTMFDNILMLKFFLPLILSISNFTLSILLINFLDSNTNVIKY